MTDRDTAEAAALRAHIARLEVRLADRVGQVRTLTALAARLKSEVAAGRLDERRAIAEYLLKVAIDVTRQHTFDWLTVLAARIERGDHDAPTALSTEGR